MDEAKRMEFILTQAIMKLKNENRQQPGRHMDALQKLASIFKQATWNSYANNLPVGETPSTPTAPKAIHSAPRTHGQKTRNNTPDMLPAPIQSNRQALEG